MMGLLSLALGTYLQTKERKKIADGTPAETKESVREQEDPIQIPKGSMKVVKTERKRYNRTEKRVRKIVERIFNKPFPTVRPAFLKNHATGRNLEIDMYCEELKLAVEYHGLQHYRFIPHYHKTPEVFEAQKERDKQKIVFCARAGIKLIIIDSREVMMEDVERFIRKELNYWD